MNVMWDSVWLLLELVSKQCVYLYMSGMAEPGGWGGFSPPTFEEDDIIFCFSIWYV